MNRIALVVAAIAAASQAHAAPCVRKDFKTVLVKTACAQDQEAAKEAMKRFAKEHGIKSCNQCHEKLAPTYNLKADAITQFAQLGGTLIATVPAPRPKPDGGKPPPPPPPPPPTPTTGDPTIEFQKYTLPNGLEVILAPDPSTPIVAVSVWYHVGSGYENYGHSGFAHLFEHMMFQGSKHVGEDRHFPILKQIGETGVNGSTNLDRTNYYEVVPSNQLETALWLESDRMGYLLKPPVGKDGKPIDFKESLANQIEVVRNERRQRYDNVPYGKARFAEFAGLYPERHPYRYLTIGKHEDLERASVADVQGFFKTWYVPANATLTISGDFDSDAARALVEKWFGSFPKSVKPRPAMVPAPVIKTTETTVTDEFAKLRQIQFAWHSPANYADGDAELDFVADALAREGTGRLYKALVYAKPYAQRVVAQQSGATFSGIFSITVTLRGEANLDEVRKIVLAEVDKLTHETIDPKTIQRVVTGFEANAVYGLQTALGRAEQLQSFNHYLGDPGKLGWNLDRYRHATADRIRTVAAKYLRPDRMVVTITNPGGKP